MEISIKDIGALEDFRSRLIKFNRGLADDFASMRGRLNELGKVWSDPMYESLAAALTEASRGIDKYIATTGGHEAYLRKTIDDAQRMKSRRPR
jgi:hypothetical protein